MRVGKTTVKNVECAVMPEAKGEVDPLLGQSFFKNLHFEFNQNTGRLKITKVDTTGESEAVQADVRTPKTIPTPPPKRSEPHASRRQRPRASEERAEYRSTDTQDGPMPDGNLDQPN